MAKAIIGSQADPRTFALLEEVRALRARVASLESALEEAERALATRQDGMADLDRDEGRPLDTAGSAIA
jgi:hypothetical protein